MTYGFSMQFMEFLNNSPVRAFTVFLTLGLLIGSFVNVVTYRLPIMLNRQWQIETRHFLGLLEDPRTAEGRPFNLIRPGSHCPNCKRRIRPWEMIPVFSYVLLLGKCAGCRRRISPRYPLVELTCGLLAGLLALMYGVGWLTLALLAFCYTMIVLAVIDAENQLLPDVLTLPLLWLGLLLNAFYPDLLGTGAADAIIGAAAAYILLGGFHYIYQLLTGKEGMAHGDFKLLAAMCAWLGWIALPFIVIISSVTGAIWGLALVTIHGRSWLQPLAFGPFLVFAGFTVLLVGPERMAGWLG